jgi:hypothetical protein
MGGELTGRSPRPGCHPFGLHVLDLVQRDGGAVGAGVAGAVSALRSTISSVAIIRTISFGRKWDRAFVMWTPWAVHRCPN